MGNKIVTIVGITIALAFSVILVLIYNGISENGDQAKRDILDSSKNAMLAEFEPYNGTTVSGDTVIATINNFTTTRDGRYLSYAVKTSSSGVYFYGVGNLNNANITGGGSNYNLKNSDGSASGYFWDPSGSSTYERITDTSVIGLNNKYKAQTLYMNGIPVGIAFNKI